MKSLGDSVPDEQRIAFYRRTIDKWIPDRDASVLVVGGGTNDRDVFHSLGFRNVTISNVATALARAESAPFETRVLDAERLGLPDASFDYAVAHAVLHHCRSPHAALLELYRVSRCAAIVCESRDSWLMQLLGKCGLTEVYECSAVMGNNGEAGGVRDTAIPNHVYRWTEREVEKTIASFAPFAKHQIDYERDVDPPPGTMRQRTLRGALVRAAAPIYRGLVRLFPSQMNLLAFRILKPRIPDDLMPWVNITESTIGFRSERAGRSPQRSASDRLESRNGR